MLRKLTITACLLALGVITIAGCAGGSKGEVPQVPPTAGTNPPAYAQPAVPADNRPGHNPYR